MPPTLFQTGRKTLPHETPSWVDPAESNFFITICCQQRGVNQLCLPRIGETLLASASYYAKEEKWYPTLLLLMPDHLHMLVSFGRGQTMSKVVSAWKRYTATQYKIVWQQGFFEHRLRGQESIQEKFEYIMQNPVRAGLVDEPSIWQYLLRLP